MQLNKEVEKLRASKSREVTDVDTDLLIDKIREVVADYNEIAAYFQKKELAKLGGKEKEIEYKSPGSKTLA